MSTKVKFGNRTIQLPGTYSRIVSGQNNPPRDLDYGKLLIIDNDDFSSSLSGDGILGGSGVAGEYKSGKDSIYKLIDINEFRDFVGYNWWWKAAEGLFNPDGNSNGVSEVYVIKPATTTPAVMTFTTAGGGSFKVKTLDESAAANGVNTALLEKGYGYSIETGVVDSAKWIFKIFKGTKNETYGDVTPSQVWNPQLIAESPEFSTVGDLISWAGYDKQFSKYFYLDPTSAVVGTGEIVAGDISTLTNYVLASGGTATYDKVDEALDAIKDLNYNYIITTSSTADPSSDATILKIVDHIKNEAKFDKYLLIAGSDNDVDTTIGYAQAFNSEKVNIVHGGIRKNSQYASSGYKEWGAFFHAAYYAGLILGLEPQVPTTFKRLNIDGLKDPLNEKDLIKADTAGVLVTKYDDDFGFFVNLHGVNTLQDSDFVLNPLGLSHLIQVERIKSQINKELIINSKLDLMSDPSGVNKFSLSEEDVIEWTKGYLERRVGTLLVAWRNVTAKTVEDTIWVDYEASPNSEIKGVFFTGRLYL